MNIFLSQFEWVSDELSFCCLNITDLEIIVAYVQLTAQIVPSIINTILQGI